MRDKCVIYLYQSTTEWFRHFVRILFTRIFAYVKFRKNKTLAKISELTVFGQAQQSFFLLFIASARTQGSGEPQIYLCILARASLLVKQI